MSAALVRSADLLPAVRWRPMHESDVAIVAELESQAHIAPWSAANFRDALAAGYGTTVGELDGEIVAYAVLMLAPGEAQLLNLTVAAASRRHGIGRELLRRLIDDALDRGADQCFLEVRESNLAALALYAAEGFMPVARRAGYYPSAPAGGAREDALVLRLGLRER
ncbi:MAG TPA: ribosomal protein S18-alanine N-acetyltransferase [Casimicrobiaceae bacterium]